MHQYWLTSLHINSKSLGILNKPLLKISSRKHSTTMTDKSSTGNKKCVKMHATSAEISQDNIKSKEICTAEDNWHRCVYQTTPP